MPSNSPVSFIHPGSPVLITGASHGLGRALALTLASRGARLMLVARGQPDLDAVVVEVRAARGEAHGIVADIEARLIAGHMALRGRGVVVHVSSDAAVEPYPRWGAYSVAKAGLDHPSRIWAAELEGTGVRVLSVVGWTSAVVVDAARPATPRSVPCCRCPSAMKFRPGPSPRSPARALAGAACSRPAPPSCGRSKAASPTAARCILAPGRPRCCSTPASCRGSSTVC